MDKLDYNAVRKWLKASRPEAGQRHAAAAANTAGRVKLRAILNANRAARRAQA